MKNKISVFGTTYTIKQVAELVDEDNNSYGQTNFQDKVIVLAKTLDGDKLSKKEQAITLLHELCHVWLHEGGYDEMSSTEAFVEWLARSFYNIIPVIPTTEFKNFKLTIFESSTYFQYVDYNSEDDEDMVYFYKGADKCCIVKSYNGKPLNKVALQLNTIRALVNTSLAIGLYLNLKNKTAVVMWLARNLNYCVNNKFFVDVI